MFFAVMTSFSCNVLDVISLKCISVTNQECKIRPEIRNINSNEPSLYPYSTEVNKCRGNCNNLNDSDLLNHMFLMFSET